MTTPIREPNPLIQIPPEHPSPPARSFEPKADRWRDYTPPESNYSDRFGGRFSGAIDASGVMRHADAGYETAIDCAREHGLRLPAILGD